MTPDTLQRPPATEDKVQWNAWYDRVWRVLGGAVGRIVAPLKIGSATNYTEVEADGTVVSYGDATTYDDVYPSSVSVGVGVTAPAFLAYNGAMKAYGFVGNKNEEIHVGFQLYHSYLEGSGISPHLHLYIPAGTKGETVIFDCEYTWANIGSTGAIT